MEKQDFRKVQTNTFPAILPGFNIARERVDQALAAQKSGDKPLCVVTDVDDTLILHPDYWGSMIATKHDAFGMT